MRVSAWRRRATGWLVACIALAPDAALASPEVSLSAGTTLGVNGAPGSGGAGLSLAMLWPVEQRFAFGGVLYADDLGTGFSELSDPNTGEPLGTVASLHRWGFGAGWRTEARLTESAARGWRMLWGVDFGYERQERDVRGEVNDAVSGVIAATGPSLLWKTAGGHSIGAALAWKHAFVSREADPDRSTDWGTMAFTWRWQRTP